MEGEEGGVGSRLKKPSTTESTSEVDYKTKAGTAWSHSYLNQKPWHPLSYPNQRRKWIAEQLHSQRQNRTQEVAREYAQEQEFFRQTALISKKDKEKMETMQAVSFMYVRPPGYNAESAKAAELEDERKKQGQADPSREQATTAMQPESKPAGEEKKKPRPKDVFGRPLPTEEEFEVLKNAPRLETGVPARVKPFGVEVRNVKCLRCGNYGHQSGDRECPLKDAIMPNEESRLRRDDPLTAIMAHVDPSSEPLKWELKRQPGNFSPPRGGFKPNDPNQQIVAEDIFDEYGGFLAGDNVPDLLTSLSSKPKKKSRKKSKQKRQSSPSSRELRDSEDWLSSPSDGEVRRAKGKKLKKRRQRNHFKSSSSDDSESQRHPTKNRHKHYYSFEDSDSDRHHRSKRSRQKHSHSSEDSDSERNCRSKKSRQKHSYQSEDSDSDRHYRSKSSRQKHSFSSQYEADRHHVSRNKHPHSSEDSETERRQRREKSWHKHSYTSADDLDRRHRNKKSRHNYPN